MTYFEFLKIIAKFKGTNTAEWRLKSPIQFGPSRGRFIYNDPKNAWLAVDTGEVPQIEITDSEIDEWTAIREIFENYDWEY